MSQSRFILQPDDKSKISKFCDARIAVATMGMATICRGGYGVPSMDRQFNHHIVDEAQSSFGDQQLLCGRVKAPSGLTTHIGDREQARCPAVQDIGPQHLYCIEK
eukprot:12931609-Heterocapsa_arctica.AAC.1